MTAAKLCSNKSEAKSPLPENKNYGSRIIDAIDSIKIFPSNPFLNCCIAYIFSSIKILILLFFISPPVVGLYLVLISSSFLNYIGSNTTLLSNISYNYKLQPNDTLSCIDGVQNYHGELQYRECAALLPKEEKIMWVLWSSLAYILPELINSLVCFIKAKNTPSIGQFVSVIIPETFHTIGVTLMIFEVLPKLNYNYCVLFVSWCVIEWGLHSLISTFYGIKNIKLKSLLIVADIAALGIFINFTIFDPFDGINRNNSDCWIAILALALLHCGLWQDNSYSTFNITDNLLPFMIGHEILRPVKHSIYAVVSLWKIIVFFASSFAIFKMNHGTTTHLFTMFGPTLSLDNVTVNPLQEILLNDTQDHNELINLTKRILFPSLILSFQSAMALLINKRTERVLWGLANRFNSRSSIGTSIPLMITIEFILFSEYFRSHNYYLFYNIGLSEQLKNLFSQIHMPDVASKLFSIDSLYSWDANLLRLSFCWIVLHFIVLTRRYEDFEAVEDYMYYNTKTLPIVEVQVIPENGTVEGKENLNVH